LFCIRCGAQLPDESKFCYKCGYDLSGVKSPVQNSSAQQSKPQEPRPQEPKVSTNTYQTPNYTPNYTQNHNHQNNYQPHFESRPMTNKELLRQAETLFPMKWFKFLIYFSLFAAAVICVVTGIAQLTGAVYDGAADMVYAIFPDLEILDIAVGLVTVVCAVLILVSRFRLAAFKKDGIKLLIAGYALNLIINIVYVAAVISIIGSASDLDMSSFGASMVGSIAMLIINYTYLTKRESLFNR